MDFTQIIADKLRSLRNKHGKTVREVANDIELSRSYLSEIETASKNPSLKTLIKLANYYEVSVTYLLDNKEEWFDNLSKQLRDFVKEENIEYLKLGLEVKKEGFSPEDIKKIMEIIKTIK